MINPSHDLPVGRQCQILTISRSTAYYQARPVSQDNLQRRRRLDALHLEYPFMGSRQRRAQLTREECFVSRGRISRLLRLMGRSAIYRTPNTSKPHPAHPIYPYLLLNKVIDRPNQVWAMEMTYIPMRRGFVYRCAGMDWASRKVLAWRLSNTLTTDFCIEAVQEASARHGTPEIFNTDQGSQFTNTEFTGGLQPHGIQISMDGRGCWRDNVFVERLWKSLTDEEVYRQAYDSMTVARKRIAWYFEFSNQRRAHTALDRKTPDAFYIQGLPKLHCAA